MSRVVPTVVLDVRAGDFASAALAIPFFTFTYYVGDVDLDVPSRNITALREDTIFPYGKLSIRQMALSPV